MRMHGYGQTGLYDNFDWDVMLSNMAPEADAVKRVKKIKLFSTPV